MTVALSVRRPANAEDDAAGCSTRWPACPPRPRHSSAPISYVDYRAVAAARPGALEPASLAEFLALTRGR